VTRRLLVILGASIVATLIALAAWTEFNHAAALSTGSDMDAYWEAAQRLRSGEPLYRPGIETDSDLYRYAPWFAAAWVPLTYLPKEAVLLGWMALCVGAAIGSVASLAREGLAGWAALVFLLPFQLEGAAFGNVQPLLVLMLMWGAPRRSGPVWIALGASLKGTPLLLATVYAGRGEWKRVLVTLGLTALLVAPMLLFDLSSYSTEIGSGQLSPMQWSPLIWAAVAALAIGITYRLANTRYAWLAGSVATMLALPRFLLYQISFVIIGMARDRPPR
jgi:predicted membrane protein